MRLTINNKLTKNIFVTKEKSGQGTEINYEEYFFSTRELIINVLLGIAGIAVISRMFFDSMVAFILLLPAVYLFLVKRRENLCRNRKQKLEKEFRDVILSVSANLGAGYSVENAFRESYQDISMLYGENSLMAGELYLMMRRLRNNDQLEDILLSLGIRRIGNTARMIEGKSEVRREIDTIMSEKRLEQRIMELMPFGMMLYVSLTSPGFFNSLYHNLTGVLLMGVCLILYVVACLMAEKILKIEV